MNDRLCIILVSLVLYLKSVNTGVRICMSNCCCICFGVSRIMMMLFSFRLCILTKQTKKSTVMISISTSR